MRALLILISLLVVATVGVYGAGSVLPQENTLIRGAYIAQPVDEVWQAVSDFESMPQWNSDISAVKRVESAAGENPLWRMEYGNNGYMLLKVEKKQSPLLLVSHIVESSYHFSGLWIVELSAQKNGTWVNITEKKHIPSPFVRFAMYYIIGVDKCIVDFFNNLGQKFNQPVEVEELVA